MTTKNAHNGTTRRRRVRHQRRDKFRLPREHDLFPISYSYIHGPPSFIEIGQIPTWPGAPVPYSCSSAALYVNGTNHLFPNLRISLQVWQMVIIADPRVRVCLVEILLEDSTSSGIGQGVTSKH